MSNQGEVKIELTANESKLIQGLRRGENAAKTFGSSVKNVFADIGRAAEAANKTFGTFGKITAALGSGVVLKKLFSLDEFEKVDDALLMMQANLHMNAKELDNFKSKLASMAGQAGEDMGELFLASKKLSKSYNADDILKIMDASAMAADAMEQDLTGVQERIVQIMKMYHKTPDEAKAIAEALVASNADPEMLNTLLQRGMLKGGAGRDYKEVLAMASALKKGGFDNSRAVMAIESVMFSIDDNQKVLKRDLGVDLFKVDPSTGKKVKKSYDQILAEMKPGMEKLKSQLGEKEFNDRTDKIFGPNASEAFSVLFSNSKKLAKAYEEQGRAGEIAAERTAAADEKWSAQFKKIKGHLAKIKTDLSWIYDLAKKPMKFLAYSPNLVKGLGYGAAGLSLAVLGGMAVGKGREFLKNYKGTAVGVAEGMALEAVTGVKPVFVTNWPGSAGRANGGLGTRNIEFGAGVPPVAASGGGALGLFAKASQLAGVGLAAYEIGSAIEKKFIGGSWGSKAYDLVHGGDAARDKTTDALLNKAHEANKRGDRAAAKEFLNQIKLIVNIDKNGRVSTDSDDMNTGIEVERGELNY